LQYVWLNRNDGNMYGLTEAMGMRMALQKRSQYVWLNRSDGNVYGFTEAIAICLA